MYVPRLLVRLRFLAPVGRNYVNMINTLRLHKII